MTGLTLRIGLAALLINVVALRDVAISADREKAVAQVSEHLDLDAYARIQREGLEHGRAFEMLSALADGKGIMSERAKPWRGSARRTPIWKIGASSDGAGGKLQCGGGWFCPKRSRSGYRQRRGRRAQKER